MIALRRRLASWRSDPRLPGRLLAAAMFVAALLIFWMGRGATFSGDEIRLVVATPGLDPQTVFEPHGGHLMAIGRLVYWPILELSGFDYRPFRLLALITLLAMVGLFFLWARRRTDPWLALAICVLLLFFGADPMHMFQGNGFIVMLSVVFGLAALIAFDRADRSGDLLACLFLCLGVLSYSVILAFIAGIAVQALLARDWRRLWVPAVPLAGYLLWRLWLTTITSTDSGGALELSAILLIPAWSFQSLGGILTALAGLGHDFSGEADGLSPVAAPLAVLALGGLALVVIRERPGRLVAVTCAIALALWSMQALAAGDANGIRLPGGDSRYMYPGAIVVALVAVTAVGRSRIGPRALLAVAGFMVLALAGNLYAMRDGADLIRQSGAHVQALAGAITLAREPEAPPVQEDDGSAAGSLFLISGSPYGEFGFSAEEIARESELTRQGADRMAAGVGKAVLVPATTAGRLDCRPAGSDGPLELEPGTVVLRSASGGAVTLGRFAEVGSWPAGELEPGRPASLNLPGRSGQPPWKLTTEATDLEICR